MFQGQICLSEIERGGGLKRLKQRISIKGSNYLNNQINILCVFQKQYFVVLP